MHALIIDGPHAGRMHVPEHQGDMLKLAEEGSDPLRPHTIHLYRLVPPEPDDFENGIEARYLWVP